MWLVGTTVSAAYLVPPPYPLEMGCIGRGDVLTLLGYYRQAVSGLEFADPPLNLLNNTGCQVYRVVPSFHAGEKVLLKME